MRETWFRADCTLNGKPAIVLGLKGSNFAEIVPCAKDGCPVVGFGVMFSWVAVDRIMRSGGAFKA